jgi:UDP-2,3-diacylglucosamine pyrophosphatase LpxH
VHAFIADIHLRPEAEKDISRFVSWLTDIKAEADAVYILGDLFDYWYTGLEERFREVLGALSSPGVHLLKGNRDFLLKNFLSPEIHIIPAEEFIIRINDTRVLIAHGHTLTQGDTGFRLLHRFGWPLIESLDRMLPLNFKDRLAQLLVDSSAAVRPSFASIREGIEAEKDVDLVICGHLHRYYTGPGLIVLPAFFDSGQWLAWDDSGPNLRSYL